MDRDCIDTDATVQQDMMVLTPMAAEERGDYIDCTEILT